MEHYQMIGAAREIRGWLEDATCDYSHAGREPEEAESMADELWESEDWLRDMAGDQIHDLGGGDNSTMVGIASEMKEISHPPLCRVLNGLIKRWTKQ